MKNTINNILELFELNSNGDVCLKTGEGELYEAMRTVVFETTDMVDVDSAYAWTHEAVEAIKEELDCDKDLTPDQLREAMHEWNFSADTVYTLELIKWLAKSLNNYTALEEVIAEYGWYDETSLADCVMHTQMHVKERIAMLVIDAIQNLNQ